MSSRTNMRMRIDGSRKKNFLESKKLNKYGS
jgi:hypothetical protein